MHFIYEKIGVTIDQLKMRIVTKSIPAQGIQCCAAPYKTENTPPADAKWEAYEAKSFVIPGDSHMWFCFTMDVPQVGTDEQAYLRVSTNYDEWGATNPQALLYMDGGTTAIQAFDENHMECPMQPGAHEYRIYLYGHTSSTVRIQFEASVIVKNKTVEKLYYDMKVPYEAMNLLDSNSYTYAATLNALDRTCLLLDFRKHCAAQFVDSVKEANNFLEEHYYQKYCGKEDNGELSCVGHSHLDVAWCWTLAQTREKAQRTFSNAMSLMEQYPDYVFISSQPQLYEYVKQSDPELFEKIKARVKEGRWEAEGAMWLEPDMNLTSGESFVRQIVYGKRFMQEELGVDNHILWLPDTFGYSAALPQILKKSGIDLFFTTKLYWNESNLFPHTNFMWRGIDGTEIFSVQTDEVNKNLSPAHIKGAMDWHKDKRYSGTHIATIGYGDGGGGTTVETMEYYARLKRGIPGMPKVSFRKAGETLEITRKQFEETTKATHFVPRWEGEIYLELHRGTFTTSAENKLNNRKAECLYLTAEETSVCSELLLDHAYPTQRLKENWYPLLKNQFHDILPGSSIERVYEDSRREYGQIMENGEDILSGNLEKIADHIQTDGGYFVYNPTSFSRSEVVECDGKAIVVRDIPPHGYAVVVPDGALQTIRATEACLENELICVRFDENYHIVSVFDKKNRREVIRAKEKANLLTVYEHLPKLYQWDIEDFYPQKKWTIDSVESVEWINEPAYAAIRVTRAYGKSKITQLIRLDCNSARIDFITDADWHEERVLLKTLFPLDVHTNQASCEIQFGHIQRPTHYNTSWDQTMFEVCAHKWVDLSEGNYGVALLNDCKYGHSFQNDVLTLSLLMGPTEGWNPNANMGKHHFVYSLYPHSGDVAASDVIKQGYALNHPLKVKKLESNASGELPAIFSFVQTDRDNAVVETIKKAEDGDGYIVRLYDSKNVRGEVVLTFGLPVKKAYICDLLENEEQALEVCGEKTVTTYLSNFEIKTLKVIF